MRLRVRFNLFPVLLLAALGCAGLTALSGGSLHAAAAAANAGNIIVPPADPFEGAEEVLHFSFERSAERPYDGDKDLDNMPDDWNRRKGPNFPLYVNCGVDRNIGRIPDGVDPATISPQSFRVDLNGGPVELVAFDFSLSN